MFSIFKRDKRQQEPQNLLFMFCMHIERGSNADMPPDMTAAYVSVYLGARTYEEALTEAVAQIRKRGYVFVDLADGKFHQLDPLKWKSYVREAWPEFEEHFPTQEEVIEGLNSGRIFFSPYAGYGSQSA